LLVLLVNLKDKMAKLVVMYVYLALTPLLMVQVLVLLVLLDYSRIKRDQRNVLHVKQASFNLIPTRPHAYPALSAPKAVPLDFPCVRIVRKAHLGMILGYKIVTIVQKVRANLKTEKAIVLLVQKEPTPIQDVYRVVFLVSLACTRTRLALSSVLSVIKGFINCQRAVRTVLRVPWVTLLPVRVVPIVMLALLDSSLLILDELVAILALQENINLRKETTHVFYVTSVQFPLNPIKRSVVLAPQDFSRMTLV